MGIRKATLKKKKNPQSHIIWHARRLHCFLAISYNQHCAEPQDSTSICLTYKTKNLAQFNVEESNSEYSLEGLMLKLQYFSHLMWRSNSLEKTLMFGKIKGKRRTGHQRTWWLDSITNSIDMNLSKLQEKVRNKGAWCATIHGWQRIRHYLMTEQQQNLIFMEFHRSSELLKLILFYILSLQNDSSNGSDIQWKLYHNSTKVRERIM